MMATMALKLLKSRSVDYREKIVNGESKIEEDRKRIVVDSETSLERREIVSSKLGKQNVARLECKTKGTRVVSCCKHLSERNKNMYDMPILSTFLRMF